MPDETRVFHSGKKAALVTLIMASLFAFPLLTESLEQMGLEDYDYLALLVVSVLVCLWCGYDAAERGRALPRGLALGIILVVIAGYPQYLHDIRGYSYKKSICFAVLWLLVAVVLMAVGRRILL